MGSSTIFISDFSESRIDLPLDLLDPTTSHSMSPLSEVGIHHHYQNRMLERKICIVLIHILEGFNVDTKRAD